MLRSLFAPLMILLASPAGAGSRSISDSTGAGFHRGGFRAFHRNGGRSHALFAFFGGYGCGYNCGFGFDSWGYDYAYG